MRHHYRRGERVWVRVPDRNGSRVTGRVVGRGRSPQTIIVRLDRLHPLLQIEQPYSFTNIERIRTEGGAMSWDFSMYVDVGGDDLGELNYDANHTCNVSSMFILAFQHEDGIRSLDGEKGRICRRLLRIAIAQMEDNPKEYEALNPTDWGDYESALALLRQLLDWCTRAPGARMRVS